MLNIRHLTLGDYQTNCYIVWEEGSKTCCVIDPGYEPETVLDVVEDTGLTLEAILLTHGHFDHVGAVRDLAADSSCRVFLHPAELSMPKVMTAGKLIYTDTYNDGDALTLAGLTFRVLHTPGHTPGSVCLLTRDVMFSGDTLFSGSCGRTDLPKGSRTDLTRSLSKLAALEEDYRVLPGHGPASTLAEEKRWNPYLSQFASGR